MALQIKHFLCIKPDMCINVSDNQLTQIFAVSIAAASRGM